MAHVVEGTRLVTSVHAEGATKLVEFGIFGVEGVDEGVEVFLGFLILLHLAEGEGACFVCLTVGWIGGDGLSGLSNDFERSHNWRFENLKD